MSVVLKAFINYICVVFCLKYKTAAALKGKTVQRDGQSVYVPDFGPQSIAYSIVSDSIILFANGDSFDHFLRIIAASHNLLGNGFAGHKAPLRGAIGYGDLIYDTNSIWIGSAIEDAYVGESSQVWSGCAITRACEQFISKNGYINQYREFLDIAHKQEQDPNKTKKLKRPKDESWNIKSRNNTTLKQDRSNIVSVKVMPLIGL